jgi:hypothetical protein
MTLADRADRGPSPLRPPTTPFRVEALLSPIDSELHPVIHAGRVAVITGAASGIGHAAAHELARFVFTAVGSSGSANCCSLNCRLGLKIAIADINEEGLKAVAKELAVTIGEGNVLAVPTDVSKIDDVVRLRDKVYETWGEVRLRPGRIFFISSTLPSSLLICVPSSTCPPTIFPSHCSLVYFPSASHLHSSRFLCS